MSVITVVCAVIMLVSSAVPKELYLNRLAALRCCMEMLRIVV